MTIRGWPNLDVFCPDEDTWTQRSTTLGVLDESSCVVYFCGSSQVSLNMKQLAVALLEMWYLWSRVLEGGAGDLVLLDFEIWYFAVTFWQKILFSLSFGIWKIVPPRKILYCRPPVNVLNPGKKNFRHSWLKYFLRICFVPLCYNFGGLFRLPKTFNCTIVRHLPILMLVTSGSALLHPSLSNSVFHGPYKGDRDNR